MEALSRFLDDVGTVATTVDLEDVVERHLDLIGLRRFEYLTTSRSQSLRPRQSTPFLVSNYPSDWIQRYLAGDYYRQDPLIMVGRERLLPFYWDSETPAELPDDPRRIMEEAGSFGLRRGLAIPIHGPDRVHAIFCVASGRSREDFASVMRGCAELVHLMALHAHALILERFLGLPGKTKSELTDREKECLTWTARGKTSWEAAEIIGITENTVNFHLKNAGRKLGTVNKTQAAATAVSLGLIDI